MKDAYWMAVDYGVVARSPQRLGVKMQLVEAGGYTKLKKQISQIEDCVSAGAQGVVIGAISYRRPQQPGLRDPKSKNIPVIDVINGMSSPELVGQVAGVVRRDGRQGRRVAGQAASERQRQVKVAWFPGPPGAGWVEAGNTGFSRPIKGSDVEVVETKYGDTGKEVQSKLVEDTLRGATRTSPTSSAPRRPPKRRSGS